MKQFFYTLQHLIRGKGNNYIKVISLTLGLVVALVLFSQVAFEMSYDNFYPDKERIYNITVKWSIQNNEGSENSTINAPFAPTMYREFDEVESATVMINSPWKTDIKVDNEIVKGTTLIADSLFFNTFGFPVISGNIAQMGAPYKAFISESYAKKLYGKEEPLGKTLKLDEDENSYTVVGVFKDIPKNSHLQFDVLGSFHTLLSWSNPGWQNNDAYRGYVKLAKGVDPKTVEAKIPAMMRRHYDVDKELENGTKREFFLRPVTDIHTKNTEVRRLCMILSILAFSLLFSSAMNYVLLAISSYAKRAKAVGVYKCNGASVKNIFQMFIYETLAIISVSLLLAFILIFIFKSPIETLIKSDLSAIFAPSNLWVTGAIIAILVLITGYIPARIFSSIPVTQIFRTRVDSKKQWKQILLFIQFSGITFMFTLLAIIISQYQLMLHSDIGYSKDNLVYSENTRKMTEEQLEIAKAELTKLSYIESVTLTSQMPIDYLSGMSVQDYDTKENLFTGNFLMADADYIKTFGITLKEGKAFSENNKESEEIIVNETFVKKMGYDDPIGKKIFYFFRPRVISGVMKDYQYESMYSQVPPIIVMPAHSYFISSKIVTRLNTSVNTGILTEMTAILKNISQNDKVTFASYNESYNHKYSGARLFRNSVMTAALIMLVITLLGMIGFVDNEVIRRTKEIAIRKVHGAKAWNIFMLLIKGMTYIALPAILMGICISYLVGSEWLQQFTVKVPLGIILFTLCGLVILLFIQITLIARTWPIAYTPPIKGLKTE